MPGSIPASNPGPFNNWKKKENIGSKMGLTKKYLKKRKFLKWNILPPGLNFINILCAAFTHADPNSVKRYWQLNWNFTLSGPVWVKAVCRALVKLRPGGS